MILLEDLNLTNVHWKMVENSDVFEIFPGNTLAATHTKELLLICESIIAPWYMSWYVILKSNDELITDIPNSNIIYSDHIPRH